MSREHSFSRGLCFLGLCFLGGFRFWVLGLRSSQASFFDLQGFYKVKSCSLFRFTGSLQSQVRPPFLIYRVFTKSSHAPFFDLQGLYRVKSCPLFRFAGFLQCQVTSPLLDLQGFYRFKSGPLFRSTRFLQIQVRPPFSIYRVFTESSHAPFFDLQGFYRVKPGPLFRFTGSSEYCFSEIVNTFFYKLFTQSCKKYLQVLYKEDAVNICYIFYSIFTYSSINHCKTDLVNNFYSKFPRCGKTVNFMYFTSTHLVN